MKIIEIIITNTKKLKAFHKVLNGENMEVAGDTATGKTTAISALWNIIEKQGDALTHGEKKGSIVVKLGDGEDSIVAERIHTKSSSTINLTKIVGGVPEKIATKDFKDMLSKLAVNPHKIMDMGKTERVRTLLAAANVDIDLEKLDKEIEKGEEERLRLHRRMESIEPGEEPENAERVNTAELVADRDKRVQSNLNREQLFTKAESCDAKVESMARQIATRTSDVESMKSKVIELEKEIAALREKKDEEQKQSETHTSDGNAIKLLDVSEVNKKLATIDATNKKAAAHEHWEEESTRYENAKEEHLEQFRDVKYLQDKKKKALERAEWPLEGLSIQDGEIVYNDIQIGNLGESEQMLITAALATADIEKHPLKVCRMDGVESMSAKDFSMLQKVFNDRGIQVLSTRVSRGDTEPQELVIVDGEYEEEGGE